MFLCSRWGGAGQAEKIAREKLAVTLVPNDYFTKTVTMTEEEAHFRYADMRVLDKRVGPDHGQLVPGMTVDECVKRINKLRTMFKALAKAKLEKYFVNMFNKFKPGFTFNLGSRSVNSVSDFVQALHDLVNDDGRQWRMMTFFVLHRIWGRDNAVLLDLESEIMAMFRWEYSGVLSNGEVMQRKHKGGCIKHMLMVEKNSLLGPIKSFMRSRGEDMRVRGRDLSDEAVEKRNAKLLEQRLIRGPPKDPNRKKKPEPRLVRIDKATERQDGFDGYIGIYENHPSLINDDVNLKNVATVTGAATPRRQTVPQDLVACVTNRSGAANISSRVPYSETSHFETHVNNGAGIPASPMLGRVAIMNGLPPDVLPAGLFQEFDADLEVNS
jgi:hypothetical protein